MRVLIVEDEPYMAVAIRDGLRLEAIAVDIAGDGDTALELLSINSYDIAVLDRDIPGPSAVSYTHLDVYKRQVLLAVKDLGYRPNRVARSLRTRRNRVLALIISGVRTGPFFADVVRGVEKVAYRAGYLLFPVSYTHLDVYKRQTLLRV